MPQSYKSADSTKVKMNSNFVLKLYKISYDHLKNNIFDINEISFRLIQ